MADAGIDAQDVDTVIGGIAQELALALRLGPCTRVPNSLGVPVVLQAAQMIAPASPTSC